MLILEDFGKLQGPLDGSVGGTLDRFENFKFKIIWPPMVQN